ncbi:hypothetical protein VSDG_00110 [Cytospora chrysosperma]|uniref:Uncharacterized protein n=1 Tax=Cytospora chrysosperma TaxID=252740 RepID=A0A423WPD6_CYTCH|nr:hypothetical protein VSDG_00110 [Valsa sordida]
MSSDSVGYDCLRNWLDFNKTCPFCRIPVEYELCKHSSRLIRPLTRENLYSVPDPIPSGGKISEQCFDCSVETNRKVNQQLLDGFVGKFKKLRAEYQAATSQHVKLVIKQRIVGVKLRMESTMQELAAPSSTSRDTCSALRTGKPHPEPGQLEHARLFPRTLECYNELGDDRTMTVFEVLRSRRAFRPDLPVQSEDIRWGYVLSGMRDEWFEEHWNRWKAGETPSFVKTTFVRVVNSAVVWTIMCGNEIYDQMSALGMTADNAADFT